MFNLFNKHKVKLTSLSFPDFGWEVNKDQPNQKLWINPEETLALSVNFFSKKPDLPPLSNLKGLQDFYRQQIIPQNGGLVQVDLLEIKGITAIKTIFKFPQNPSGTTYLGSLTFPFQKHSFVLKIQAPETGTTGSRDSSIAAQLLMNNTIRMGKDGYEDWFADPYDPSITAGTLMNRAELPKHDLHFPTHPLSLVRQVLFDLEAGLEFGAEIFKLKGF